MTVLCKKFLGNSVIETKGESHTCLSHFTPQQIRGERKGERKNLLLFFFGSFWDERGERGG